MLAIKFILQIDINNLTTFIILTLQRILLLEYTGLKLERICDVMF
jgi:hypothetical protein